MKKIIEIVIVVFIMLLSAVLCIVASVHKKKQTVDVLRVAYDSTIKKIDVQIKDKQDSVTQFNKKKVIYRSKIALRKANITKLKNNLDTSKKDVKIDTLLQEYTDIVKNYDRLNVINDSIIILKNDQIVLQNKALLSTKNELIRTDLLLKNVTAENESLKKDIDKLNKKLNRRKKFTTILVGTILTFGYLLVK